MLQQQKSRSAFGVSKNDQRRKDMHSKKRSFDKQHQRRLATYLVLFALLLNITYIPCYFYTRNVTRENVLARHRRSWKAA